MPFSRRRPFDLAFCLAAALAAAGCAPRGCGAPTALDFVDAADRRADIAHAGLVRDSVGSTPTADPRTQQCSVWERVHVADAGQAGRIAYRPQHYLVTDLDTGLKVSAMPGDPLSPLQPR